MRWVSTCTLLAGATAAAFAAWLPVDATTVPPPVERAGGGRGEAEVREAEEAQRPATPPRLQGRAAGRAERVAVSAETLDGMPEDMAALPLRGRVVDARTGKGIGGAWVALQEFPPGTQVLIH